MLKKHNKVITLLVLVAFMFTIGGSVGAAVGTSVSFPDVEAGTVEAAAVYRLAGLGILEGYPDGTFGVEKTITRAEFSKIAVSLAGLQSVANGMEGIPSGYPDVVTDHWASGWINVATSQGFMKGYTDGSFGPENQITMAEVITVLMRLLGYNDNLPGTWPGNYVSQAANMNILDDVTFLANQAATRGQVSIMASEVLNSKVVVYKASDNVFETKADPNNLDQGITLLEQSFKSTYNVKNTFANNFHFSGSDLYLDVVYFNDIQDSITNLTTKDSNYYRTASSYKIAESCVFSGGTILDVYENFVEFDVNDDGEIISISVKKYGQVAGIAEIKINSSKRAEVDNKKLEFTNEYVRFAAEGLLKEFVTPVEGNYELADTYKLILNKNGKIAAVGSWMFTTAGIVESIEGERIHWFDGADPYPSTDFNYVNTSDFKNKELFVQRDGKPVTLADLQPMDAVIVIKGGKGCDFQIVARSLKVKGNLDSIEYIEWGADELVSKVKVDDVLWTVSESSSAYKLGTSTQSMPLARISLDGGATFEDIDGDTFQSYDLWDQEVEMIMSPSGLVAAIVFGDAASAVKNYAVATEFPTTTTMSNDGTQVRLLTVMREDGAEITYPVSKDTRIQWYVSGVRHSEKIKDISTLASFETTTGALLAVGTQITNGVSFTTNPVLLNITLKSSGIVDRIEILADSGTLTAMDSDNKTVRIAGTLYDAQNVVVYNMVDANFAKTKVVGWNELKNLSVSDPIYAYYAKNKVLQFVIISNGQATSDATVGLYVSKETKGGDQWVTFLGAESKIFSGRLSSTKGDLVAYTFSGNEIDDYRTLVEYRNATGTTVAPYGVVARVSNNMLEFTNGVSITTNADTKYFDASDKDELTELTRVYVSDQVRYVTKASLETAFGNTYTGNDRDVAMAVVVVR